MVYGQGLQTAWAEFSITVTSESKGFLLQSIERIFQGTHELTHFKHILQDCMNLRRYGENREIVEMVAKLRGEKKT